MKRIGLLKSCCPTCFSASNVPPALLSYLQLLLLLQLSQITPICLPTDNLPIFHPILHFSPNFAFHAIIAMKCVRHAAAA